MNNYSIGAQTNFHKFSLDALPADGGKAESCWMFWFNMSVYIIHLMYSPMSAYMCHTVWKWQYLHDSVHTMFYFQRSFRFVSGDLHYVSLCIFVHHKNTLINMQNKNNNLLVVKSMSAYTAVTWITGLYISRWMPCVVFHHWTDIYIYCIVYVMCELNLGLVLCGRWSVL